MKLIYTILGVLLALFGLLQIVFFAEQGFHIANVISAVLGGMLSYTCFRIAFAPKAKDAYVIAGVVFGIFTVAQLMQLLGVFGIGFSIAGVGFTILAGVLSFICFRKVFAALK